MRAAILRFLKKSWYWVVLVASSFFLGLIGVLFLRRKYGPNGEVIADDPGSHFPERIGAVRERRLRAEFEIERIQLESEVARARVSAVADVQRAELDQIQRTGEADPVAARMELAAWIGRNL